MALNIVPSVMRKAGHWAIDAFNDLVTPGLGLEAVLPEIVGLSAFSLRFFATGISRFRYQ